MVLGGRDCIHVKFSGKQIPYFAYNVARIRVADEDLVMSREEITSFLLKTGDDGNRWENLTSNKTIEDVDEKLLKKYVMHAQDVGRIAIEYTNKETVLNQFVEIYNPGVFPEGLEPRDYIERAERPIRRNPKIARMLYYSKDIESFGTGLRRIANACDNAGVRYEFQKKKTGFVVCFYRHTNEKNEDKLIKADKKPIKADKKPIRNERYTKIIEYIKERGSISNKETRELLGIADSTAKRILKKMVEDKILIGKGERKARKYLLR